MMAKEKSEKPRDKKRRSPQESKNTRGGSANGNEVVVAPMCDNLVASLYSSRYDYTLPFWTVN